MSTLPRKWGIQVSLANYTASSAMPFLAKIEREILEEKRRSAFLTASYRLKRRFTIKNVEVEQFLSKHSEILFPLLEASEEINRIFSRNADELCLSFERDPEEDFETLFVVIKTSLPSEKALELLEKFDEEWWLNIDNEIKRILQVDIEVVSR